MDHAAHPLSLPPPDPDAPHAAAAAWISVHQGRVWRYLRFLGCPCELAEDLVQDVFVLAIERGIEGRDEAAARAWLRTTARHLLLASRRARSLPTIDALDLAWVDQPDDDAYVEAVRACVAELEERERTALQLRYGDNAPRARIAEVLALSEAGAKAILRRARGRVRACVERRLRAGVPR